MAAGISTRNRATIEKSSLLLKLKACTGQRVYPLRTPRLEDTVLDAHTREPITVTTESYLDVLRFCRWPQPGHNQKLAHLISEIRLERLHLTEFCSWMEIHPYKKKQWNLVCFRHLIFSFVYWYKRPVLLLLMICIYV